MRSKPQAKSPRRDFFRGYLKKNTRHRKGAQKNGSMRDIIKLESTAGTGFFYTTTKNRKTQTEKLQVKKYDPKARKHVLFVEKKISK